MKGQMKRAKELAFAHWSYHDIMFKSLFVDFKEKLPQEYIKADDLHEWYIQIFIHGYKHAIEDLKND